MRKESFDISIDGFSGPLDLLCHLVESRQMQASRIKVAHLVRIYGAYLTRTRAASAETIAEFFFMAAGLLLEKTRSLLPVPVQDSGTDDGELGVDEDAFLETLARYRPYREAARWLWERREREMRHFCRILEETESTDPPRTEDLEYDIGDLYFLSRERGLFTWNKPARACLASRIPYGEPVTKEGLERIEAAERFLAGLLPRDAQFRVRAHGNLARIEADPEGTSFLLKAADAVHGVLRDAGFRYVTLDLKGYRMGSLNEALPDTSPPSTTTSAANTA